MKFVSSSLLLFVVASTRLWAGAVISLQPSTLVVSPGQTFSMTVEISNVIDLYAFQLDLAFNPAVLSALSVTEGPFLSLAGSSIFLAGAMDNAAGTISANADTLQSAITGVSGNGVLLSISFQALAEGSTSVQAYNQLILNSFGEGMASSTVPSAVLVYNATSIPEPAAWMLLAAGLPLLIALRRTGNRFS